MINVKRLAHVTLATPDLERQVEHYCGIVGLHLAARERDRVVLATNMGQVALILERASQPDCPSIAFEVSPALDLAAVARDLAAAGLACTRGTDALPGIHETLSFHDPKGTRIDLLSQWAFLERGPMLGGAVPLKLGHIAFGVPDPAAITDFYCNVLGFRVSDWIGDFFAFLRCNADHHSINFVRAPSVRLHHVAFEMRDAAHIHNTCDLLGQRGHKIVWGPVRHGPGHNVATYHEDSDGQLIEYYAELDRMLDEDAGYFEPRPWHRDRPQRPKVWDPAKQRDMWGLPPSQDFIAHVK